MKKIVLLIENKKEKARPLITTYNLREKRGKMKILVAEDNPVNQKLIKRILEKRGADVMLAENGKKAVERFSKEYFDIILMDIQMPNMDGVQAAAEINGILSRDPHARKIPIIALTAYALAGDKHKFLSEGMDDYLSKPLRSEELLKILKKWLPDVATTD